MSIDELSEEAHKDMITIEKMAKFIYESDIDEDICKVMTPSKQCIVDVLDCVECIIKFFERE